MRSLLALKLLRQTSRSVLADASTSKSTSAVISSAAIAGKGSYPTSAVLPGEKNGEAASGEQVSWASRLATNERADARSAGLRGTSSIVAALRTGVDAVALGEYTENSDTGRGRVAGAGRFACASAGPPASARRAVAGSAGASTAPE